MYVNVLIFFVFFVCINFIYIYIYDLHIKLCVPYFLIFLILFVKVHPDACLGDKKLDLLLCTVEDDVVTVSFLSRLSLHLVTTSSKQNVLVTNGSACDMLTLDFDEDGDTDLILSQDAFKASYSRYFERVSHELIEHTGPENPLAMFGAYDVHRIADVDGDGRLEVLATNRYVDTQTIAKEFYVSCFRRARDGSFVEDADSHFMYFTNLRFWTIADILRIYVADWDSDGLPDLFMFHSYERFNNAWSNCFRHVVDNDLAVNSQIDTYEDVGLDDEKYQPLVVDWNRDGFDDIVVLKNTREGEVVASHFHLYQFEHDRVREVPHVFDNVTDSLPTSSFGAGYYPRAAVADWDQDGDFDLLIAFNDTLHYHEMVSGSLQKEEVRHPFTNITLATVKAGRLVKVQPVVVDFDNDGDMDLFLGPPDGRYFEQLADGTLKEWPPEQSPVRHLVNSEKEMWKDMWESTWYFLDCDGDGDSDLLRFTRPSFPMGKLSACENRMQVLRCDVEFQCLGTDLRHFNSRHQRNYRSGGIYQFGLGNVTDGRLKFIGNSGEKNSAQLWIAGMCVPIDPCNQKGMCLRRRTHCSCIAGHELHDCSGCEPNFYSLTRSAGQMHDCKPCPGVNGNVCHGRGACWDDASAKALPQESTATLMAVGNGSCMCSEAHFYGSDEEGHNTCADGVCPAGTEEDDGNCFPCAAGSFSTAGSLCRQCGPGKFSLPGSSACSICPHGTVSKDDGAQVCDACPAGRYEVENQFCNACPAGFISPPGNDTCTKCQAGFHAQEPGSLTCTPCTAGTYAAEASPRCSVCPPGSISSAASATCSRCDAGRFAATSSNCEPCVGGTFAGAGSSMCKRCPAGKFSLPGSSACSICPHGTVSKDDGAQVCDACPAGRYEVENQFCNACPAGFISPPGNDTCTKCQAGFHAQEPGSLTCTPCTAGTYAAEASPRCSVCPPGSISSAASATCSRCDAGRFAATSSNCEPCVGGTFAGAGSSMCRDCPSGRVSSQQSASCEKCEGFLIRSTPDATKQTCQVLAMDLVFAALLWLSSSCFCSLISTGIFNRLPISDVSAQGQKFVVTASMGHFLLKWSRPSVFFSRTAVPILDSPLHTWAVTAMNSYQLTLHADERDVVTMPLDTSTGYLLLLDVTCFCMFCSFG